MESSTVEMPEIELDFDAYQRDRDARVVLDKEEVRSRAAGRMREILIDVCGIPAGTVDSRKEVPCPKCGGATRFRVTDLDIGRVFCNQCCKDSGDIFATVMWKLDLEFRESVRAIADYLGMTGEAPKLPPGDPLDALARAKGVSRISLVEYGAVVDGTTVSIPTYGEDGRPCSNFTFPDANHKGLYEKDKPAGLFFPLGDIGVRLPQPGEQWVIVEGVKDAAALHSLGYLACGMNTKQLNAKFAPLFQGCDIVLVPDRDRAGVDGAIHNAKVLHGFAKRVRQATLPAEFRQEKGPDVRDVLRQPGGVERVRRAIRDARVIGHDGVEQKAGFRMQRITARELAERNTKIDYIIPKILVQGQPCIMGGPSKSMKTSILADLAVNLATGGKLLGVFPVSRRYRVGFVSAESGEETLKETAGRIARRAGWQLADLEETLVFSTTMPDLTSPDHLEALEDFVRDDKLEVLILDPAYLALAGIGESAGNLFLVGRLLRQVASRCAELGVTLIVAHHSTKFRKDRAKNAPLELEDLAWAGFSEFARQWILVNRREDFVEGSGEHLMWLKSGGSAGHSGLWGIDIFEGPNDASQGREWEVTVQPASQIREATQAAKTSKSVDRKNADIRRLMEAMATMPDGGTVKDVRMKCRPALNHNRCETLLRELEDEGIAKKVPNPKRKDTFVWHLVPEDQRD